MFLDKYIDNVYYQEILNEYKEEYLNNLDETNFINIYNIFKKHNFSKEGIEDIIVHYLPIFELNYTSIEKN